MICSSFLSGKLFRSSWHVLHLTFVQCGRTGRDAVRRYCRNERCGCLVVRLTSSFSTWWYHLIPSSFRRNHWLRALVLCGSVFLTAKHSEPYTGNKAECKNYTALAWWGWIFLSFGSVSAVRCRTYQKINLSNFKIKFQSVAEKTAKNFRGYFILPHPVGLHSRTSDGTAILWREMPGEHELLNGMEPR